MEEYDIDETRSAKFNAGVLQTQRINKILDTINFCKNNPTAFNTDYNDYNYNVWLRSINSLYDEVDGFVKEAERIFCLEWKHKIEEIMQKFPVLNKQGVVIVEVWNKIRRIIESYERIVKRKGTKYEIISAFKEEAGMI